MPVSDAPELIERRAPLEASTFDAEARTVEVVFAAGAGVERFDSRGPYTEFLAADGYAVAPGTPVLDGHRRGSVDDQLGVVLSARTVGREARAIVRLSRHHPKAERIAGDLADGIRFGISVGYTVEPSDWKESTDPKTGRRTKTATRWTVREISVVPVPADPLASTRSNPSMPETVENQPGGNAPANPGTAPADETMAAAERAAVDNRSESRSETPGGQNRAEVNAQIRAIARPLGLSQTWIDSQIDAGRSVEDARRAALDEMIQRGQNGNVQTQRVQIGNDYTDPDFVLRAMAEGQYTRLNPDHEPSEPARPYAGLALCEIAERIAGMRGIRREGMSRNRFLVRMATTSDFANILADTGQRVLRDHYRVLGSELKPLGRKVTAPDFRPLHSLQLSEGQLLEKVNEHGEVKAGKFIDARETFSVDKHALRFGVTDRVIIDDDIGLLEQMGRAFGSLAAGTEGDLLVKLITANGGSGPKMSDGKNVFHADHGNIAAPGVTPWLTESDDVAVLAAIRTAMRRQKGLQGQPVSIVPKFIVVPPEGEAWGEKVLTQITAAKVGDVNPFPSRLQLVVEPRLTDTKAWYVVADPVSAPALEYAHIDGEEGPTIESRVGWEIEGIEFKLKITFGAGFVDWRGWYRNPGDA
ncbi:prohead protease/major capsid protein fusion protein [Afifella sp. YEN Y35]|uniref:prohead protease/major capsid protein fusion protein n=1 Tax=Afifella sp. YEN Y35 TaxID=3388337 RepID=UPI0039DFC00C